MESGHIERVLLKEVSEEYANDPAFANTVAVRLIHPYIAPKEPVKVDEGEEDDEEESGGKYNDSRTMFVG